MQSNYFQVQRGGIHSTFQDFGYNFIIKKRVTDDTDDTDDTENSLEQLRKGKIPKLWGAGLTQSHYLMLI